MPARPILLAMLVTVGCAPELPQSLSPEEMEFRELDIEQPDATVAPGETFALRLTVPAAIKDSYSVSEPRVLGRGVRYVGRIPLPNTHDGEPVFGGGHTDLFVFEAADRGRASITFHHVWDHRPQRRRAARVHIKIKR